MRHLAQDRTPADARRGEVARATWRVIAREGLDRASMRAIAQELGCTTGVLTHYFRDKDALLAFAMEAIVEQLGGGQLQEFVSKVDIGAMGELVAEYLPTDGESRIWWKVWLSFTVAAFANDRQAAAHAKLYANLRRVWTGAIRAAVEHGEMRDDIDPALEAESLLCLVDGIGIQALISPRTLTAKRQRQMIDTYLARLKPPSAG